MYLFILIFFLIVWFPICLFALIINSESDGDTIKETLAKFCIAVSLWLVLIVTCSTLLI
jgi:hypothetical protein